MVSLYGVRGRGLVHAGINLPKPILGSCLVSGVTPPHTKIVLRPKSQPDATTASLGPSWKTRQRHVRDIEGEFSTDKVFSGSLVWSLLGEQKWNLVLGGLAAAYCTSMNLAAPVLSGYLFEILVTGGGVEEYRKVGWVGCYWSVSGIWD